MIIKYKTKEGYDKTIAMCNDPKEIDFTLREAIKDGATEAFDAETGEELLKLPF